MGFIDVFSVAAPPTGGGVTLGMEPWKSGENPTTVLRPAKPFVLYGALTDEEASMFLQVMGDILARESGDMCAVRPDGTVTDPMSGIRWSPAFNKPDGIDRLSRALENAGFDPTRSAVQVYVATVGGASGSVHWRAERALVVRLLHGSVASPQIYQGRHSFDLAVASPMVFATEIKTFMGL